MTMQIPFEHRQSAHCETGVAANLLSHYGLDVNEAMAFGIGSGLFFGYLPFIRLNHLPLTTYRITTGGIMKRLTKRLGVKLHMTQFRNPRKAMDALEFAGISDMALEDAWVLARCLSDGPMAEGLARYQTLRKPRVTRVVDAATANARNYHLSNPVVRSIAHGGLRVLGSVAPDRLMSRFDWLYGHDVTRH